MTTVLWRTWEGLWSLHEGFSSELQSLKLSYFPSFVNGFRNVKRKSFQFVISSHHPWLGKSLKQLLPQNLIKSSPMIWTCLTAQHWSRKPCCFQVMCFLCSRGSIDRFDSCWLPIPDQRWPVALPKVVAGTHPSFVSCQSFCHFKSNQKFPIEFFLLCPIKKKKKKTGPGCFAGFSFSVSQQTVALEFKTESQRFIWTLFLQVPKNQMNKTIFFFFVHVDHFMDTLAMHWVF